MNGLRRATLLFCGIAILIVVGSLVGAVYFAPPRGQMVISGIAITGVAPSTLLPRHGLACATDPDDTADHRLPRDDRGNAVRPHRHPQRA